MEAVRVRYNDGVLVPLQPVCFQEGEEVDFYILRHGKRSDSDDRTERGCAGYRAIYADDNIQHTDRGEGDIVKPHRNQAFEAIQKVMDEKYPNLDVCITPQIKAVAGFSFDMNQKYAAYSDKEILAAERGGVRRSEVGGRTSEVGGRRSEVG